MQTPAQCSHSGSGSPAGTDFFAASPGSPRPKLRIPAARCESLCSVTRRCRATQALTLQGPPHSGRIACSLRTRAASAAFIAPRLGYVLRFSFSIAPPLLPEAAAAACRVQPLIRARCPAPSRGTRGQAMDASDQAQGLPSLHIQPRKGPRLSPRNEPWDAGCPGPPAQASSLAQGQLAAAEPVARDSIGIGAGLRAMNGVAECEAECVRTGGAHVLHKPPSAAPEYQAGEERERESRPGATGRRSVRGTGSPGEAVGGAEGEEEDERQVPAGLDPGRMPSHVAIILDGNSRWAKQRGMPKEVGHEAGVQALKRTVRLSAHWGVHALTVFAFSTENWSRPKAEVEFLMLLLERVMDDDIQQLHQQGVAVRVIGDVLRLPASLQRKVAKAEELTAANTQLRLSIALSYSGRQDIVQACRRLAERVGAGELRSEDITEEAMEGELATAWLGPGLRSPDLLIRTSGEQRLSNFLLWQAAYTELVFSPCLWPDFALPHFRDALLEFQQRDRRFGGRKGQSS